LEEEEKKGTVSRIAGHVGLAAVGELKRDLYPHIPSGIIQERHNHQIQPAIQHDSFQFTYEPVGNARWSGRLR
jgi:hypothetical protein